MQIIKHLINITLISFSLLFNSCTNAQSQTESIINQNRVQLYDNLKKLEDQQIITKSQFEQLNNRLNANYDAYLQQQDIELEGLEKMFFETIKSFENIKINQPIFSCVREVFYSITSQIIMRSYPTINKKDYAIQSDLIIIMNNWFENYQTDTDKLVDLINQINTSKSNGFYKDISNIEFDEIISIVRNIKNNSSLTTEQIKIIVIDGMKKYVNKTNESNLEILNYFSSINQIKKLDIDEELKSIYEQNFKAAKVPTYAELKEQVSRHLKAILAYDLITASQYKQYLRIILNDIDLCEKTDNQDQVRIQLLSSLKKLKSAELDTEDREAIAEWYYILAEKKSININTNLNDWLYSLNLN